MTAQSYYSFNRDASVRPHVMKARAARPTSYDVARAAGVSQATVSRVLRGSVKVLPETRDRVVEALERTGYSRNAVARAMATGTTETIGVVVEDITSPFYPELLRCVSARLARAGSRVVLWTSGVAEPSAIDAIRERRVDGVIFTSARPASAALRVAVEEGLACVLVNRQVDGIPCDSVVTDNDEGARTIAEHLVALGHTRIAFLGAAPTLSTAAEREAGLRSTLQHHGLDLPPAMVVAGEPGYQLGHDGLRRLLGLDPPPTSVFCVHDLTAFGALGAAMELGVRVPDAVSVTGFDDVAMAAWHPFSLTTVRQPTSLLAAHAVNLLLARISEPDRKPVRIRLAPELIVRRSTAAAIDAPTARPEPSRR